MQDYKYPLATTTWNQDEIHAMHEVISSGQFTMGKKVEKFQQDFAERFGSKHAVMSNSGSSANLLALAAIRYSSYGPRNGKDEVIVPAVSWSTSYFPVTQLGFKLKFIDIDLRTLNAPFRSVRAAIDEKTAGVLIVNLLGNPAELLELRQLCDEFGIFMVEDNCESMGAEVSGRFTGTFGHVGTFSTFFSHHISTMEGGISVTDSEELAQFMTSLRAHGWTRELPSLNFVHNKSGDNFQDSYRFVLPGYNLRPLELEGAIGIQQLKKIPAIIQGRRENAVKFKEILEDYPEIITQQENGKSSWFGFSLVLSGKYEGKRSLLINELENQGVAYRPIVAGNFARNPVMRHLKHTIHEPLTNADFIHENGLFIGNHHYPLDKELEILRSVLRVFDNFVQ